MANIKELIHWELLNSVFKTNGEKLIIHKTKEIFNSNIYELNNIATQQSKKSTLPKLELIEEVYEKFKALETEPIEVLSNHFSKREVRLLVWSLDYKGQDSILFGAHFLKFVSLVNEYWRDSYIIPIWYILLKNWNTLKVQKNRFVAYSDWLQTKCDAYSKSRKDVLAIKKHFNFWQLDGVGTFVNYLISKKIPTNNICNALYLNTNIIGTDYYFESLLLYLNRLKREDVSAELIQEVINEVRVLKNVKYQLLYLSTLLTNSKFSSELPLIQRTSVDVIGDPLVKRYWQNNHLKESESDLVESARKKLIVLMNKDFIEHFFSKLVQDPRREAYWLKFIDNIEDIKFVGNKLNKNILKSNEQISEYVNTRYYPTRSNQSTCALIIWAKDYVFVEFSDTGSLYIYKNESFRSNIKLKYIERIENLKIWPRDMTAVKLQGNYHMSLLPEGNLAHRGDWESRLNVWMNKYFYN
jgi:hypothetical protein